MTLVFATHNLNKLKEVQALVPEHIHLKSLTDIGCHEDIIEDAPTITGNAILKAQYVKENYGYDCFADDTGLEVTALQGAPGVYSARYAGPQKNAQDNMDKLLRELHSYTNRQAQFKTVIAFAKADTIQTFDGICKGTISLHKQGEQGFGYDPIFIPEDHTLTFAQMTQAQKGIVSHRGRAMTLFIDYLSQKQYNQ